MDDFRGGDEEQLEFVLKTVCMIEFNERFYRRIYNVPFEEPIKGKFTPESVRRAVARLTEIHGCNWDYIKSNGYRPVIRQVLEDYGCMPLIELAVTMENRYEPFKPLFQYNKQKRTRYARHANALPLGQEPPPLLLCYDEKTGEPQDEEQDGDQEEPLEEDIRDSGSYCLVAEGVSRDVDPGEMEKAVRDFCTRELEVVPESRNLLTEVLCPCPNVITVKLVSGTVAELVLDACNSAQPSVLGMKPSWRRDYFESAIALIQLLVKELDSSSVVPSRLVYVHGVDRDWTASRLKKHFEGILEDVGVEDGVKSVLMLPRHSDLFLELRSDTLADLLFYRCSRNNNHLHTISKDLFICRSNSYLPRALKLRTSETDVIDVGNSQSPPVEGNDQGSATVTVFKSPVQEVEEFPPGFAKSVASEEDAPPGFTAVPKSEDEDDLYNIPLKPPLPSKAKLEIRLHRDNSRQPTAPPPPPPPFSGSLKPEDHPIVPDVSKEPSEIEEEKPYKDDASPSRHLFAEDKPFKDASSSRHPFAEEKLFKDASSSRSPFADAQSTLIIGSLDHPCSLGTLRRFFQKLSEDLKRGDDFRGVDEVRDGAVLVKLRSEAAADAVMDAYIERPADFVFEDAAFRIFRSRDYVRPGSVSKYINHRAHSSGDGETVLVTGLPPVHSLILKGALAELLDREFAANRAVKEYGGGLLKSFSHFPANNNVRLIFHSRAPVEALLSLKKPLKLGGNTLSFFERRAPEIYSSSERETRRCSPRDKRPYERHGSVEREGKRSRHGSMERERERGYERHRARSPERMHSWNRFKDELEQRKLLLRPAVSDVRKSSSFFQHLLERISPGDDFCMVKTLSPQTTLLELGSEAAADRVMDEYIGRTGTFAFDNVGIYRDKYYRRPGAPKVDGESERVDGSPAVVIRGFSRTAGENTLRGALSELLERELASPQVTLRGWKFFKRFERDGDKVTVKFSSGAAVAALRRLKKTLIHGGKALSFSISDSSHQRRGVSPDRDEKGLSSPDVMPPERRSFESFQRHSPPRSRESRHADPPPPQRSSGSPGDPRGRETKRQADFYPSYQHQHQQSRYSTTEGEYSHDFHPVEDHRSYSWQPVLESQEFPPYPNDSYYHEEEVHPDYYRPR